MTLKFLNFTCFPCPTETARDRFDMYWNKTVPYKALDKSVREGKNKEGELHDTEELVGYAMRLNECISKAIKYTIQDTEGYISLKEYLDQYNKLEKQITDLIK